MPRIVERTVYEFHELDDQAKERARMKYREAPLDCDWSEYVLESAVHAGLLLGITTEPRHIRFSGFYSQGDGASFHGWYQPNFDAVKNVAAEFPTDSVLANIAAKLTTLQVSLRLRSQNYISASIVFAGFNYAHSNTMVLEADDEFAENDQHELLTQMRRFADWIYAALQAEYDYLGSDENIDELLQSQEFDEDGDTI